MDRNNRTRVAANLAGDCGYYPRSRDLALRSEIYSPLHRVSVVAAGGCPGPDKLLAHSQGGKFFAPMVRDRFGDDWTGYRRQAGCSFGGAFMTWWSLVLILVWLGTFVAGQLFFTTVMESSCVAGFRTLPTMYILTAGVLSA